MENGVAPGTEVVVRYDVAGPPEWHSRVLLAVVTGLEFVVCTPDFDFFVEDFGPANNDIVSWRVRGARRHLPHGVPGPGGSVYDFDVAPRAVEIQAMVAEGRVHAALVVCPPQGLAAPEVMGPGLF